MSMKNRLERLLAAKHSSVEHRGRMPSRELKAASGPEGQPHERLVCLDAILSVTSGALLVHPLRFSEIADLLEYIERRSILAGAANTCEAIELLRQSASRCRPWIYEQHPELRDYENVPENWQQWLTQIERKVGHERVIRPLPMRHVGWLPPTEIFG